MPVPRLVHSVFFTLKDDSTASIDALVSACRTYLADHQGIVHFSAGPRAPQYQRPVNDQAFHVALVVVFDSAESQDLYQVSPRHKEFIAEQSANWAQVRVFDSFS